MAKVLRSRVNQMVRNLAGDANWAHSSLLTDFRNILESNDQLRQIIGEIATFRVVIDANAVISEINQMVRYPERGRSALQELVAASVFEVVAPRWLEQEMDSAIPQYCKKRKVDPQAAWAAWDEFSELIVWDDSIVEIVDVDLPDPKDAPYIWTSLITEAVGILSKDTHIEAMGGNRLSLEFVFHCRSYARARTISVAIIVNGITLGLVSLALLTFAFSGLSTLIAKLHPNVRWAALITLMLLLAYPKSREWILEKARVLVSGTRSVGSHVLDLVFELATLAEEKNGEANGALSKATRIIDGDTGNVEVLDV